MGLEGASIDCLGGWGGVRYSPPATNWQWMAVWQSTYARLGSGSGGIAHLLCAGLGRCAVKGLECMLACLHLSARGAACIHAVCVSAWAGEAECRTPKGKHAGRQGARAAMGCEGARGGKERVIVPLGGWCVAQRASCVQHRASWRAGDTLSSRPANIRRWGWPRAMERLGWRGTSF